MDVHNHNESCWKVGDPVSAEDLTMLIMYRGFEVVPVKNAEMWQARIFSGCKQIATTILLPDEDSAMTDAKKIVDGIRGFRRPT